MKQKIYVYAELLGIKSCVRDAEPCGDTKGYAVVRNGDKFKVIESHWSSGVEWTKHDMGITSDWKHDVYKELYPEGYELVWLGAFNNPEELDKVLESLLKEI